MTPILMNRIKIVLGAVTVLAALGLPGVSSAAGIAFRNEIDRPIQVQGANFVNGAIHRSPSFVIPCTQTGKEFNVPPGPRVIYIYDAQRPSRTLFKGLIQVQNNDMYFVVQPNRQVTPANPYPVTLVPHKAPQPKR